MKIKITLIFLTLFLVLSLDAQSPNSFNYQAVVRNASGVAVANQLVALKFTIREGTPTGTTIYQETHSKTTNSLGLVAAIVGTGTIVNGAYPTITQLATGVKYFQVEVDPTGASSYIDMGTTQIVSVMYANFANGSATANGLSSSASITPSQIAVSGAANGQVLKFNGTTWTPSNDVGGGSDNWGTQTVNTDATLSGNGTSGNTLKIGQNGAASGNVLKWNGTAWAPATDNGSTYTGGTGVTISGSNVISIPWTLNGNNIYNNNTDNTGIGNTAPTEKLDVFSNTTSNTVLSRTGLSTGFASLKVLNANSSSAELTKYSSASTGTVNTWPVSNLALLNNGGSGALMLNSIDSIGFATNSRNVLTIRKSGEMMVNGSNTNANTGYLTIFQPTYSSSKPTLEIVGPNAFIAFKNSGLLKSSIQSFNDNLILNATAGHLKLHTNSIERMHIDYTSGAVGINTNAPFSKLHVLGSGPNSYKNSGFTFNAAIYGYCDTTTTTNNFSAGIIGQAKGSANLNAGLVGLGGYNASFNVAGLFLSRQSLSGTNRNYGTYTSVLGGNAFTIGHFLNVEASTNSISGTYGSYNLIAGTADANVFGGYFDADATNSADNLGIYARASNGANNIAGYFEGDVEVLGNLSKSGGTFKIDHPQDPANKYLIHSFVESPEMMNIYNGLITTDANGFALVTLPSYFQSLNIDFRYQLTILGSQFAQAIIIKKIEGNQFTIQTNLPNIEVSWQVTGVRNDAWAKANPIIPEKTKADKDKGKYLTPELFGQPKTQSIMLPKTTGTKIPN
ncbi:MAG: hypothetical protein HQ463_06095 [Bacteroidetes bacterium]|nr:hypothetical protein [Bacteroidota bacterium]